MTPTLRQWLFATRPTATALGLRWLLRLASLPYGLAISLRNCAYDLRWLETKRLPIPVLCVGNLSVGGTGKTPTVAWLCQWLRTRGWRVAIVSRGYGQLASGVNDEALELELQLPDVPHLQNSDRYQAGLLAEQELDMQVIVLDDGFQHRRLARDLDIVLIDASDTPAAQWLLPGGLFRESWRGLRRAQVVLLTRSDLAAPERVEQLRRRVACLAPRALCVATTHRPTGVVGGGGVWERIEQLSNARVLAFCGVGNPDSFVQSLGRQGLSVVDFRCFPDHHAYSTEDVAALASWAELHTDCAAVVCTMKDWVKLQVPRLGRLPLVALKIAIDMSADDREALGQRLDTALAQSGHNAG